MATSDFNAALWMGLADSWWDLGKKTAPLLDNALAPEERLGHLRAWVADVHRDEDDDVKAAVTVEALDNFVRTALRLLELKYEGKPIASDIQRLIADATYQVRDDGHLLRFDEAPKAFWAWEYIYLFEDLKFEGPPAWTTAVGRCESCQVFFIKARKDQRFHSDGCRKRAANQRFYKTRRRSKRRH